MTGYGFPQMEHILSPAGQGIAKIVHQKITPFTASLINMHRGYRVFDEEGGLSVGLLMQLDGKEVAMMSDAGYERRTSKPAVDNARGHVLIAGLGIGMILHPICEKPEVERVTVIEKYRDVIDLVGPSVAAYGKVGIREADIFTWVPGAEKFDAIFFDIWPNWGVGNLGQMLVLHRRYRRYLAPGGWMDSWMRTESSRKLRHSTRLELRKSRQAMASAFHRWGIPISENASVSVCEGSTWPA